VVANGYGPSLLYYIGSYELLKEVTRRLNGQDPPGSAPCDGLWARNLEVLRLSREGTGLAEGAGMRRQGFESVMSDDTQEWERENVGFAPGTLVGFFAHRAVLPMFLAAWRDGAASWPFGGRPFPRDFVRAADPLLRLRALLPDWPDPDYGRERIHLDTGEQLSAGLYLARAGRFDLLGQVCEAGGQPLLDQVRPAFAASAAAGSPAALRAALAEHRRTHDLLFRAYAADADPEPDEEAIAVDWDAVARAAERGDEELREAGPAVISHPQCPQALRYFAAAKWRELYVWCALLGDRVSGRALLRDVPMKPDMSLAGPLGGVGAGGVTAADVLELAHPADLVLRDAAGLPGIVRRRYLPCLVTEEDERGAMLLAGEVTQLAGRVLGEDADAWSRGCRLVEEGFAGSVTELLREASTPRPAAGAER
jgi:hypothetical protein